MRSLILITLIASCTIPIKDDKNVLDGVDSIILESRHKLDTITMILPIIDKHIIVVQKKVANDIKAMKAENERLKEDAKVVKTITIRDTIIIKEKTNFWGKKKVSTDSISKIDSTENL
jgi:hypothetical protein